MRQKLQAANTDIFNPLDPRAHNSECQNRLHANIDPDLNQKKVISYTSSVNLQNQLYRDLTDSSKG